MLFWVGGLERRVYVAAPNPQVISDAALEAKLRQIDAQALNLNEVVNGFCIQCDGHTYYVLNMGAFGSSAYDVTTQKWSDWNTYGQPTLTARYAAAIGDGRYVTGSSTGTFTVPSADAYQDSASLPTERRWSGAVDLQQSVRCDRRDPGLHGRQRQRLSAQPGRADALLRRSRAVVERLASRSARPSR